MSTEGAAIPRYNAGSAAGARLPPWWVTPREDAARRLNALVPAEAAEAIANTHGVTVDTARETTGGAIGASMRDHWPRYRLGTDMLGRSLLVRCLTGGGISLSVGVLAALLSVFIGTAYGALAGYAGGRTDAVMMRIVDVLYGLPYILLVVLLAVASDAALDEYISRSKARTHWVQREAEVMAPQRGAASGAALLESHPALRAELAAAAAERYPPRRVSERQRAVFDLVTLLAAIGGVSWLTMARVIRGQVLSLKNQPFVEAARAIGVPAPRLFIRHLLPNLIGPIIVYATLTVPQAILQESFLSFLGIGVKPPLPSWGNLAAEGLEELNPYRSHWWLLLFPCLLLGLTLLALNFVGESLREVLDPKAHRGSRTAHGK